MSIYVKVDIGVGRPIAVGINSTTLFAPTITASYKIVFAEDSYVTGAVYSGSIRI